jgi:cytochrome c oxidase subunit 3
MSLLHKTHYSLHSGSERKSNSEVLLLIGMVSIFMLFVPLIVKLLQIKNQPIFHFFIPHELSISTLLLIAACWMLYWAKVYKQEDRHKEYRMVLSVTLLLGISFLLVQFWGWEKIFFETRNSDLKIIAVIVIYHSIHFLIALALLASLLIKTRNIKTAADHYIFFLNPKSNLFFKTTKMYCDFLTFLWITLYVLILVKFI